MKCAILEICPEMFRTVFQLPADAKVVGIQSDMYLDGVLHIKLVGVGPEIAEGQHVPVFGGTCTAVRGDDGALIGATIDWGLPPHDSVTTLSQLSFEQFFNTWTRTTDSGFPLPVVPCRSIDLYQAYCLFCEYCETKPQAYIHWNGFLLAQENWEIKKCKLTHLKNNHEITTIERVVFPPDNMVEFYSAKNSKTQEHYIAECVAHFKKGLDFILKLPHAMSPSPP